MIRFLGRNLPFECYIAVSGGEDSMAVLHFLTHIKKRHVHVLHFNHGTEHGKEAESFVRDYCERNNLLLSVGQLSRPKDKKESSEEYWRNERYNFFRNFMDMPIIMCHHLDDAVETWVFTSCHGEGKLIPRSNGNVIRPFLITRQHDFSNWCLRHNVPYIKDPSNDDTCHQRNYIRHEVMPHIRNINPGIYKTIKKKYLNA